MHKVVPIFRYYYLVSFTNVCVDEWSPLNCTVSISGLHNRTTHNDTVGRMNTLGGIMVVGAPRGIRSEFAQA